MNFNHPVGDYHVHPDFSTDATGTLREYCAKAVELGLSEITFTTHVDTNPAFNDRIVIAGRREPFTLDNLKRYQQAVRDLTEGPDRVSLLVRCGVEVDFYPGMKDGVLHALEELDFDLVLVGVHFVDNLILTEEPQVRKLLEKYSPEQLMEHYYALVRQVSEIDVFDALAHLDVYRRFGARLFPEQAARIDYPFVDATLDHLARTGLPIEVNTSGVRHGLGDWYPSRTLLNRARQRGVRIGYLGSDAHAPEQLAWDFEVAHIEVWESYPELHDD